MGCATGIVKYLLFISNLVFALSGLCLLTIGIVYKLNISSIIDAIPDEYTNLGLTPIFLIVIGTIIFVIAFLGCCGAIRESTCMLTTFAILLLTIFIIKIAIGTYAFLQVKNADDLESFVRPKLTELVRNYNTNNSSRQIMDNIQRELQCCGSINYQDYNDILSTPPASCRSSENDVVFIEGCAQKLTNHLRNIMHIIGYVVIGIAVVELVSAIFALCLSSSIRNEGRRRGYA